MRPTFLFLLLALLCNASKSFSQQLLLGKTPANMTKSAVLELNADNQGLLLPRINDTASINSLNPPDGMVVYFVPTRRLLLRTSGFWSPLAPSTSSINFATGTTGNDVSVTGSPVVLGGTVTLNLPSVSATARGLLTSADWNTFNSKQAAGNYLTGLSGDITATGPGTVAATINTNAVTAAKFRQSAAFSLVGNPTAFSANVSDVTLGAGLSFSGNTLVNTINNNNQLANGAGYITSANVVFNNQANTYLPGMKQMFRSNATNAGLSFGGALTADPSTLVGGDVWYRSDLGRLRYFDGTVARSVATEGGTISGTTNYLSKFTPNGTTIGNSLIYDDGSKLGVGTNAPTAALHIKAASNPLRVEGLQLSTTSSVLVVDANGNVGMNSSLQLSFFTKGTFTLDLPNISNNSSIAFTVNVPGAQVGDNVIVTPSGELTNGSGLIIIGYSYVSSNGQVTIRFVNTTQTNTDVPSMTFYITVLR